MEISHVFNLLDRFEHSNLSSMKLELEGMKLVLAKSPADINRETKELEAAKQTEHDEKTEEDGKTEPGACVEVKAPLAGTFYQAAAPEDEPFITVGKKVAKGDVIGIIEAMKLMNEVVSPVDGEIQTIQVVNDEMVAFHQTLVTIKEL